MTKKYKKKILHAQIFLSEILFLISVYCYFSLLKSNLFFFYLWVMFSISSVVHNVPLKFLKELDF